MHVLNSLIGIPFVAHGRDASGLDCWGLVRLAFGRAKGISLPGYDERYLSLEEREQIAAALSMEGGKGAPWAPVEAGEERAFDVALFRRAGLPSHLGLVVEPGRMLHVDLGGESCVERYDDGRWAPRLIGFYRHQDLIA